MNDVLQKFDLTGKTAFITGAGTGLGYYMARGLARLGARVMIAARREAVLADAAAKLAAETGGAILTCKIDLADPASVSEAARQAGETLGGVDIFIGNAGQDGLQLIEHTTDAEVTQLFQVNLLSNIALCREFVPQMRRKKWGRIIFSSSVTAKLGTWDDGLGAYAATKGAMNSFIRVLAAEAGHDGITANSLILGVYFTDILRGVVDGIAATQGQEAAQGFLDSFSSLTTLGRLGQPDEVEGIVQLLASDAGSYITGGEIPVHGGLGTAMKPHIRAS